MSGAALTRAFVEEDLNDLYAGEVRYAKDAFEGLAKMDQLVDAEARAALVAKTREAARTLREKPVEAAHDLPRPVVVDRLGWHPRGLGARPEVVVELGRRHGKCRLTMTPTRRIERCWRRSARDLA